MKRRGITVLIGAILVAGLFRLLTIAPVPYAEYVPGPTFDTLGKDPSGQDVIKVSGATATESKGQLRFLTVGVQPQLTLLQALAGWLDPNDAVIPIDLVIPPGETQQQVDKENQADFANSQSAAASAADIALGYPLKVTVTSITKGTPAEGKLQVNDVITEVDGQKIDSADRLVQIIRSKPVGTSLPFTVVRNGTTQTIAITSAADDQGNPRVGFVATGTPTAPFTFTVPIENVGGPSAGLMLTLGMIDKIEPQDLTGGHIIAGTGTMDALGNVGPIGGIAQKLVAAKKAGAQYFLTPAANCAEAKGANRPDLPLYKVSTLQDALTALADIRAGQPAPTC
jgi:PDZ domain-containing protein